MKKFYSIISIVVLLLTATSATAKTIDLSKVTSKITAYDGDVLTGTLAKKVKVEINEGATVTLDNVSINADGSLTDNSKAFPGLTVDYTATIILKGKNTIVSLHDRCSGILAGCSTDYTLTIDGDGELYVKGGYYGAGIGSGDEDESEDCGNIIIKGGTIVAEGGHCGAGIGCGRKTQCGDITIENTVTSVTAIKGVSATHSIGVEGNYSNVGTITIGGKVIKDGIKESPYTYVPGSDGISATKSDSQKQGGIYSLDGARRSTMQKGINVVNGRKVIK